MLFRSVSQSRYKYVSKKSRIGYKKSIEKKYNDRAIAAGFTQYGLVMQILQQQPMLSQVLVLNQVIGMVSILINH